MAELRFPAHKAGLNLHHNPHLGEYTTVEEYLTRDDYFDFVSDDARARSVKSGELWVLQWYPYTPVGSCALAGETLQEVLDAARSPEEE